MMSCFLTCVLRCMAFVTVTVFSLEHIKVVTTADGSNDDGDNEDFFDKASIVLFEFPDFPCISAYVLLVIVWAEAFFQVYITQTLV